MEAEPKIRVLLVDDSEMSRIFLRRLLRKQPGMEVVGEAEDGRTVTAFVEELTPDVVVMDIKMPGMDCIDIIQWITNQTPDVKVIAFTNCIERSIIQQMLKAGASGYLLKGCCGFTEIISAIRAVAAGKSYFCTEISADGLEDNHMPSLSSP